MTKRVVVATVGMAGLCAAIGSIGLAPADATVGPVSCTDSDVVEGLCIPYVAAPDEDPMAEGVRYLELSGQSGAVDNFIANVEKSQGEARAEELRAVSDDPNTEQNGELAPSASTTPGRSARASQDGMASVWMWTLKEELWYGYCNASGCNQRGTASFNMWLETADYKYYGIGLSGSTYTTSGPRITPATWTCKTFDESGLWDVVVHEWSNCAFVKSPFSARSIDWQGWFQPYEKGKSFHLEYTAKFRVEGDTNGAEFGKYWNSYRYKIIAPGDARFLQ